jgi:hypothetical protein
MTGAQDHGTEKLKTRAGESTGRALGAEAKTSEQHVSKSKARGGGALGLLGTRGTKHTRSGGINGEAPRTGGSQQKNEERRKSESGQRKNETESTNQRRRLLKSSDP